MGEEAIVVVLDIGGTTTRAARLTGNRVERMVTCDTPTLLLYPQKPLELLQAELVALATDLVVSVTREVASIEQSHLRVGVSISGQVASDTRTVLSAPDLWGPGDLAYPLAAALETKLASRSDGPNSCEALVCNDAVAAAAAWSNEHPEHNSFALLMVRTGLSYIIGDSTSTTGPVLLGHLPMPGAEDAFECTCGGVDHFTSYVSGTGIVNVLTRAALGNPKAFRSSQLFRLAAKRFETSKFEERLALFGRHSVLHNAASLIDPDVWRCMHDRHAEITPAEQQRWLLPTLLDAGMFIEAVNNDDAYALELLDAITTPLVTYLECYVLDDVDAIALSGGFARALGERYRTRIAPSYSALEVQWAEKHDLDDFRNVASFLWPADTGQKVIDLREGSLTR